MVFQVVPQEVLVKDLNNQKTVNGCGCGDLEDKHKQHTGK